MPQISIIIPIYNVAAYIEKCMQSICAQSYRDFEVILVDDCGADYSVQLAIETLKNGGIEPILLRHAHNRGLSAARNTGMEVAQGEYVLFVDSDDYISPVCLEKLYAKAISTNADVTYGAYQTFGVEQQVYPVKEKPYVTAWNKLCKRSFLIENKISFIEGLIHEDNPWSFEIECAGAIFASVEDVTYNYLVREGSLQTGKDYTKHFDAYCSILKAYSTIICRWARVDLLGIFEQQKALYFTMTQTQGTSYQLRELYSLIRTLTPNPAFGKADAHYFMPKPLGFLWYKKFHKYHLC